MSKSYTDAEIRAFADEYEDHALTAVMLRQLLAQRDEAREDADELGALADTRCVEKDFIQDELTAAKARISELEEALKPFAEEASIFEQYFDNEDFTTQKATVGDLRRARSTLSTQKEGDAP